MQDLSYFIENWNTDMVSLSALICIVLMVSGYFYGKVMQKYIKPLKKIDCTFLGVFFIFALFQIFVFFAVSNEVNTSVAQLILAVIILIAPLVCLLTWSNPLPDLNNLFGLVTGLAVAYVLSKTSAELNTNNIYFDSVHYLSAALENSVQSIFGRMNYYYGTYEYHIDRFHEFEGFVYLWGILLRWVRDLTKMKESLTPVYIWGASFVYWMGLGNLIWNSVTVLFKKWWKIPAVIIALAVLSPYNTNYWNTTLAFFGNTLRPVIIGTSILLAYLYVTEKDGLLFIPQMFCIYAALCATSSGFFLEAFITAGLFFYMTWANETKPVSYYCFILSCMPIIHYIVIYTTDYYRYYYPGIMITIGVIAALLVTAVLIRKHFAAFNRIMRWLFPIAVAGMIAVSFVKRNGMYPYSYFFQPRSQMDMTNNFTSNYEARDGLRNILLYIMLACLLIRPLKIQKEFKLFLLIIIALFINPLVQPAVSNYMTSDVYSRVFDVIVNPFTITFLLANIVELFRFEKLPWLAYVGLLPAAAIAFMSYPLGKENLEVPYANTLIFKEDGFDWKTKVAPDSWDLYNWIDYNIYRDAENRPKFLSQDVGLKGYVSDIEVVFSSSDFRDSLDRKDLFEEHRDMVTILYPEKRYDWEEVNGDPGDYSKLSEVLQKYEADYLIIRNTIALWDERGWYNKSYQSVLQNGQCSVIYENDTWALLKVDPNWVPAEPETEEGEELIG